MGRTRAGGRNRGARVPVGGPVGAVGGGAALGLLALTLAAAAPAPAKPQIHEIIRSRIEGAAVAGGGAIAVGGERIHSATELPRFYESRGFMPAWVTEDGPTPAADSMLRAIQAASREGLEPEDYHVRRIRATHTAARQARRAQTALDQRRLADLDLLLTDAFLLYGAHLVGGVVDPVTIHPEWNASRREADLVALLESALSTGRINEALLTLVPAHPGYARLRDALQRYRAIAETGGWPEVEAVTLRRGSEGEHVERLRRRLALAGDLPGGGSGPGDVFDEDLETAVRRFQRRHGLRIDGVVGLETSAILNAPVEERIRTVLLNMERWRWLPRDLGSRYVLVNIAGFELDVVEGDSTVLTSRVMVGQQYRKTPVFSDRMTYLVLSPTWTIPPNILEQDKLPLIRRDPGYLRANRIRVLNPDGSAADPATIDWSRVSAATTRLRFRMDPGPENPLGVVKFMFPNPHHVYLHDTPGREMFDRTTRAFSSGCIRVERALDLAAYLLRGDARWTRERIRSAAASGTEQTVPLARPVPVHLLYWTAWAEPDGSIHFRPDVYGRDAPLEAALRLPPPAPPAGAAAAAPRE